MIFREVVKVFEEIEKRSGRIEITELLAGLFSKVSPEEGRKIAYLLQEKLAPSYEGLELGVGDRFSLQAISLATGYNLKEVENEYKRLGDLGLCAEFFLNKKKQLSLTKNELSIDKVYDTLIKIAKASGEGSQNIKIKLLVELLNNAYPEEGKYIFRIISGQLRIKIGDPTIMDALSLSKVKSKEMREKIERAYNLCADLGYVAEVFLRNPQEVENFKIEIFKPLRPALAERLKDAEEIIKKLSQCAVEYKFDGFRMQIHKKENKVEIFSRRLEKITYMFPDIVEAVKNINVDEIIFEGEALAYNEEKNKFYSFQETMHRRRKYGIEESAEKYPLYLYAFDIMYLNGVDYTVKSYIERRKKLEELLLNKEKKIKLVDMKIVSSKEEIEEFFEEAIEKGLEGIMAKDLNALYTAGARKFAWIKLKKSYGGIDTIDATIVGYYYGKGHRAQYEFGGLLVAVYNPERERFETIAKVGGGYSEEELKILSEILPKIRIKEPPKNLDWRMKPDFWVLPKYVVEIGFDDISVSTIHTCGMENNRGYALRFPRIIRIRYDKEPYDSTTTQEVVKLFNLLHKGKEIKQT